MSRKPGNKGKRKLYEKQTKMGGNETSLLNSNQNLFFTSKQFNLKYKRECKLRLRITITLRKI